MFFKSEITLLNQLTPPSRYFDIDVDTATFVFISGLSYPCNDLTSRCPVLSMTNVSGTPFVRPLVAVVARKL